MQPASAIWRCGNTYQSSPCADGRSIDLDPPPTAAERRAAQAAARREAQRARQMANERQAREREAALAQMASARLARQQADALDRERQSRAAGPRTPPIFRAQVPVERVDSAPRTSGRENKPQQRAPAAGHTAPREAGAASR